MTSYGKVTNAQEIITHKRANRSVLSQEVTTKLQETDSTTNTKNNKKEPQKKYRLGKISKKITGGLKHV